MRTGIVLAAGAAIGLLAVFAAGASAATITVNVATDEFSGPTGATCSVREAVQSANTNADFGGCARVGIGGRDTIVLQGGEAYTRSLGGLPEDANESGDLDIAGPTTLEVEGDGRATIDSNDMDRAIEIHPAARLTASRLAITDGLVNGIQGGTGGGGISNRGRLELSASTLFDNEAQRGGSGCGCGGAIESHGPMELRRVDMVHNLATIHGGGLFTNAEDQTVARSVIQGNRAFFGGGINAWGELHVRGSTIMANDATGSTGESNGGGLYVEIGDDREVRLTNSTVSGNRATENGGGIFRSVGGLIMNAVTVSANTADLGADGVGHGGGIDGGNFGATADDIRFTNSVVAGNLDLNPNPEAPDCIRLGDAFGAHNLLLEAGGCAAGGSDVTPADAKLKELDDNGGPTRTHALKRSSRAIGRAGRNAPARDQRGVKRDAQPDIGAFER